MANMTNDVITALAKNFQPYLLFDPMERFFPAVAEEWLDHQASERWDKTPTHERGTAVLLAQLTDTSFSAANVVAGNDPPAGGPLQLSSAAPDGIGQAFHFNPTSQDLFLDCAGWDDTISEVSPEDPTFTSGDIDYLDLLFRGLANAMNSSGIPLDNPTPPPKFDFVRSTSPTVYVEIEWAGRYPILDQDRVNQVGGQPDFPPSIGGSQPTPPGPLRALDNYLTLNYYLFYPAMEPSPAVAQPDFETWRNREGQWEAISIFLKGNPNFDITDPDGRPDFDGEPNPQFVVYSRGYKRGQDNFSSLDAEVRPWIDIELLDTQHPVAYVTAGTHKNLFSIAATTTTVPGGQSQPNPDLNTTGGALMGLGGSLAGTCLGLLPPPLTLGAIVCLAAAGGLGFIGFILFLLSEIFRTDPPATTSESPQSSQPGTDVARDGGPSAVPAGAGGPPAPSGLPPSSVVQTTLRFISRFRFDPTTPVTAYPLPSPGVNEMPTWWLFPGRWGVRVMNRASGQWDSGTRRTDAFERSRGYWNAYQLVAFLGSKDRAQDGITP